MKIGDLVRLKAAPGPLNSGRPGIVIKLFGKKVWRTQELGPMVNWDRVEEEPHAEVLLNENVMSIPITELKLA